MHELTRLIREDMKPALGVTEPGAIAFAAATAREHLGGEVEHVYLRLNSGMFKNAFTCGIPGSDEVGELPCGGAGSGGGGCQEGAGMSGGNQAGGGAKGPGNGGERACQRGYE